MTKSGKWRFWIDRGGTFTDLVALDPNDEFFTLKLLSDGGADYDDASVEGMRRILGLSRGDRFNPDELGSIRMGTTVATNALLERRGEPTVFVVTEGFGDLIEIGDQRRPDLFALDIRKPKPLYDKVIEARERVGPAGKIVRHLDEGQLEEDLRQAYRNGIRAAAIAFLHGYRYPEHEIVAARIARQLGFSSIAVSHKTIPLMKIVPRAETAVADAYLSPVLERYMKLLKSELGGVQFYFMRSSGGLAAAEEFAGKDAILSGPAGGLVGAAAVGLAAGFDRIVAFDMGGTSTDVAHFAGRLRRVLENEVAGIKLKVPMLDINTVAAGGGSICNFERGRYRVGPDSAGADPGPACYGRGGPLTVTDCNLLLGRLDRQKFPAVFGKSGAERIDLNAARKRAEEVATEIEAGTGMRPTIEDLADGFLEVAIEHMCRAIRKVSIERGHDLARHALVSFGGAGGQHACRIAERLGIDTVIVHRYAGLQSAVGMGLARINAIESRALELPLDDNCDQKISAAVDEACDAAISSLVSQGLSRKVIEVRRELRVKYRGSDATLTVPGGKPEEVKKKFEREHQKRFGFISPKRDLIVEAVIVEASGEEGRLPRLDFRTDPAEAPSNVELAAAGRWRRAIQLDWEDLRAVSELAGPAMISDPYATTIVEPGWTARTHESGCILLERSESKTRKDYSSALDPVLLEVFNHRFMNVAEEMGGVLELTAHSVNIKERLDFSCALFDETGGLVANAPHMPVHLGSMGESVASIAGRNRGAMNPGDGFLLNDPYNGGTHLPDVTIVMPVFISGPSPTFYVAARGHHADIGGIRPGSMPASSSTIDEEGVLFDNFPILQNGQFAEEELLKTLKSGQHPARNPEQNVADIKAQIAACTKGVDEMVAMTEEFGLETVRAYMKHVQENATAAVREVLGALSDGEYVYKLDNGLKIRVGIRLAEDKTSATIDFSGTSAQHGGNFNAPLTITRAAVLFVLRALVAADIPLNDGCLEPITLIVPEGCFLNPEPPAAVVAGNVETSQAVTNALLLAMGRAAASQGTMNNFAFGTSRHQYYETLAGGAGAGPGFDGASAVQVHMTNSKLTDPEVLEWRYPVIIKEFSVRRASGGRGRHRGGDGVRRRIEFLEEMELSILSGHRVTRPPGLDRGFPGACGRNLIERSNGDVEELPGAAETRLAAGEKVTIETPGGGGCGTPEEEG